MKNPTVTSGNTVKAAQIAYNKWFATYTHSQGLLVGMKNAVGLIPTLNSYYDFAINESCQEYSECAAYQPFIASNKAVFGVEYKWDAAICTAAKKNKMKTKYCSPDVSSGGGSCSASANWVNCFK